MARRTLGTSTPGYRGSQTGSAADPRRGMPPRTRARSARWRPKHAPIDLPRWSFLVAGLLQRLRRERASHPRRRASTSWCSSTNRSRCGSRSKPLGAHSPARLPRDVPGSVLTLRPREGPRRVVCAEVRANGGRLAIPPGQCAGCMVDGRLAHDVGPAALRLWTRSAVERRPSGGRCLYMRRGIRMPSTHAVPVTDPRPAAATDRG